MDRKRAAISGAVIVASGLSVSGTGAGEAPGHPTEPATDVLEAIPVDRSPREVSDFLDLGDAGAHDDDLFVSGTEFDLAQTIFGGDPDDVIAGDRMVTVTHPTSGLRLRYIVNPRLDVYLDPRTGRQVRPPAWALRQLKALK